MYDRGSKNFLGFARRKAVIKAQNAIDDKYYGTLLTNKLSENQKDIDYRRRSKLVASFADKTIPASETLSEYIPVSYTHLTLPTNREV